MQLIVAVGTHFSLEDFLDQLRQMKKLGSLESIVGMLPGGSEMIKGADLQKQEKEFRRKGLPSTAHFALPNLPGASRSS